AGIMSSLVAMRFGAPLLLVFLIVGMLAGEEGLGGVKFDDVRTTYVVGSIALALILFDGGLRTRFATFRSVLGSAVTLATAGVLLTAALTAPVAKYLLAMSWTEALLVGAVVASTDAAAVFFLVHAGGFRMRPCFGAARLGLSRRLSCRPRGRQPADARPQYGGGVSRCRDLARPNRDVRAARPPGVAGASRRDHLAGARGGWRAHVRRAPRSRIPV